MPTITTFLTFNDQAEEAVEFYTSIFKNSRIVNTTRYGHNGPGPAGSMMTAAFELEGQPFVALNGGPSFSFSQGISLLVTCETQDEIDKYWEKLSTGGETSVCGWLTDKFGVSWQVAPRNLGELMSDPDPKKSKRVMEAMLQMTKIEIEPLERAAREPTSARAQS